MAQSIAREEMEYDVVIVGAGPSGLSAAIRLKQLDANLSVVVLEKGSEVGAHILSGAVLDPSGLDALLPDWRSMGAPIKTEVKEDNFYILGPAGQLRIPNWPMPPLMGNHGNYIVSMANVCRWMAQQAEALGVEIFPGMSCSELVYGADGEVRGVVAGEFGKSTDGTPAPLMNRAWFWWANMSSCPKACAAVWPKKSSPNTICRRANRRRSSALA